MHTTPTLIESHLRKRAPAALMFVLFVMLAVFLATNIIDLTHRFEWVLSIYMTFTAMLLWLPWLLVTYVPHLRDRLTENDVANIELMLAIITSISWIGSFGLYHIGIGYDSLVHATASALGPMMLAIPLSAIIHTKLTHVFAILFFTTMAIGLGIELAEWITDTSVGTSMFGERGQPNDTARDLIYDTLGALVGSTLALTRWKTNTHKT